MGAFHAYDIRGVYNVDFDKDVAYKVGYFLPELLSAEKVLVRKTAFGSVHFLLRRVCFFIPQNIYGRFPTLYLPRPVNPH